MSPRLAVLALAALLALTSAPALARTRRLSGLDALLSGPNPAPGQTLRLDRVGAVTLQLNDLAWLRVRISIPF